MTTDVVRNHYRIWKEKTSVPPSGRYLSLYKAWIKIPEEDSTDYTGVKSKESFQIINTIMEVAARHQYPLTWWSTIHNLYILKKQGLIKIHKLQTINKIESELNLYWREIITRRLIRNAEKANHLHEDQLRGKNGRIAINIVLGKSYNLDTMHIYRANFRTTIQKCQILGKISYSLKYNMTTAFRLGPHQDWHNLIAAGYRIGQGATDGPSVWMFISDIIPKCYSK
eukprot:2937859-Ditylum_brightwellii.AAC.1